MHLTYDQRDALSELLNIGVGRAAACLSEMAGERVELCAPRVILCDLKALKDLMAANAASFETVIYQDFAGEMAGRAALAFPRDAAMTFGQLLGHLYAPADEMDLDVNGILMEVGNVVLNAVLGTVGNLAATTYSCSLPELSQQEDLETILAARVAAVPSGPPLVLLADARFRVARRNINGSIVMLLEVGCLDAIVEALTAYVS